MTKITVLGAGGTSLVAIKTAMTQWTFKATAPTSPTLNQVWADTSAGTATAPTLKQWNGTTWVTVGAAPADTLSPVDNGDGTATLTPAGAASITDNGDGTATITSAAITDNNDGTATIAA